MADHAAQKWIVVCKKCGEKYPLGASYCTKPTCKADLNLYGDIVEIKFEPKPEPQPQPKPEPKPQPRPEPQPQPRPEPQPQPRPEPQPQPKPEPQPQPKPEPKPQPKPEPQPQPKPNPGKKINRAMKKELKVARKNAEKRINEAKKTVLKALSRKKQREQYRARFEAEFVNIQAELLNCYTVDTVTNCVYKAEQLRDEKMKFIAGMKNKISALKMILLILLMLFILITIYENTVWAMSDGTDCAESINSTAAIEEICYADIFGFVNEEPESLCDGDRTAKRSVIQFDETQLSGIRMN